MKTIKLPHLLFSLAVIAALVVAAIPSAPAYAMAPESTQATLSATDTGSGATAIVCRNVVKWRDGHRIVIRVCKRVHRPNGPE
jgi:hypothetical protein